jgi:hypothetical protein
VHREAQETNPENANNGHGVMVTFSNQISEDARVFDLTRAESPRLQQSGEPEATAEKAEQPKPILCCSNAAQRRGKEAVVVFTNALRLRRLFEKLFQRAHGFPACRAIVRILRPQLLQQREHIERAIRGLWWTFSPNYGSGNGHVRLILVCERYRTKCEYFLKGNA